jgi:hypothetical protein
VWGGFLFPSIREHYSCAVWHGFFISIRVVYAPVFALWPRRAIFQQLNQVWITAIREHTERFATSAAR